MIYEIELSKQADADLRGIYEYIAFELLSPDNAARQLDRLEEHIAGLEDFPERQSKVILTKKAFDDKLPPVSPAAPSKAPQTPHSPQL